jgi:hypothetical protein
MITLGHIIIVNEILWIAPRQVQRHTTGGTLILNGGAFKALGFVGSNKGRIELKMWVLEVGSLTLGAVTIDIILGTLIVPGDQTASIQAYAQAGYITTFGQHGSRGALVVQYDAE